MPIGVVAAGVAAAGGIAGGLISAGGAESAANTQAQAANNATAEQAQMFQQIQANLSPYMNAGTGALSTYQSLLGLPSSPGGAAPNSASVMSLLQNYPGYQFALGQGQRQLNQQNAARGLLTSGAQVRDSTAYGQGAASGLFNQYLGQVQGLTGLGENAAAGVGNAGLTTGQGIANTILAGGTASAAGTVGAGNALSSGLSNGVNNGLLAYLYGGGGGLTAINPVSPGLNLPGINPGNIAPSQISYPYFSSIPQG